MIKSLNGLQTGLPKTKSIKLVPKCCRIVKLIDLVMLIDTYRSMIVRFTLPEVSFFLRFSLCGKRKPLVTG